MKMTRIEEMILKNQVCMMETLSCIMETVNDGLPPREKIVLSGLTVRLSQTKSVVSQMRMWRDDRGQVPSR